MTYKVEPETLRDRVSGDCEDHPLYARICPDPTCDKTVVPNATEDMCPWKCKDCGNRYIDDSEKSEHPEHNSKHNLRGIDTLNIDEFVKQLPTYSEVKPVFEGIQHDLHLLRGMINGIETKIETILERQP